MFAVYKRHWSLSTREYNYIAGKRFFGIKCLLRGGGCQNFAVIFLDLYQMFKQQVEVTNVQVSTRGRSTSTSTLLASTNT